MREPHYPPPLCFAARRAPCSAKNIAIRTGNNGPGVCEVHMSAFNCSAGVHMSPDGAVAGSEFMVYG